VRKRLESTGNPARQVVTTTPLPHSGAYSAYFVALTAALSSSCKWYLSLCHTHNVIVSDPIGTTHETQGVDF